MNERSYIVLLTYTNYGYSHSTPLNVMKTTAHNVNINIYEYTASIASIFNNNIVDNRNSMLFFHRKNQQTRLGQKVSLTFLTLSSSRTFDPGPLPSLDSGPASLSEASES